MIVAVNGFPVASLHDLRRCLIFKPVELTVTRTGQEMTICVTPEQAGPQHQPGQLLYRRTVQNNQLAVPTVGRTGNARSRSADRVQR